MKKGQADVPVITFAVIVIALLILAPVMLKIFGAFKTQVAPSLGVISPDAGNKSNYLVEAGGKFIDGAFILVFFLLILLVIISSMLIDTSPVWVILYLVIMFFMFLVVPNMVEKIGEHMYDSPMFASEASSLTFFSWIRENLGKVLLGVAILSGIILYGKIFLFPRGGKE